MQITIHTIDVAQPDETATKTINWRDSSDRKWLTSHLHWAMHNNREVTLSPVADSN